MKITASRNTSFSLEHCPVISCSVCIYWPSLLASLAGPFLAWAPVKLRAEHSCVLACCLLGPACCLRTRTHNARRTKQSKQAFLFLLLLPQSTHKSSASQAPIPRARARHHAHRVSCAGGTRLGGGIHGHRGRAPPPAGSVSGGRSGLAGRRGIEGRIRRVLRGDAR